MDIKKVLLIAGGALAIGCTHLIIKSPSSTYKTNNISMPNHSPKNNSSAS